MRIDRHRVRFLTVALAATALSFPVAGAPQGAAPATTTTTTTTTTTAPATTEAPAIPVPAETDLTPPVYTYEVGGRRDPFRSLLLRERNERRGQVPGLAGMLVDELELQGTIRTKGGWIAMMRGSDNKSYLVRKGATVFDGEVTDITADSVTFRQNVNDPTNPKPFRDVVKALSLQRKP